MDENNLNLNKNSKSEDNISVKTYLSVGMGNMLFGFLTTVISTRLFDFYENEIGLSTVIVTTIFIVYALISIVNNPLIGYFIDNFGLSPYFLTCVKEYAYFPRRIFLIENEGIYIAGRNNGLRRALWIKVR